MRKRNGHNAGIDIESIKIFMKLSARQKLHKLEALNAFFEKATPLRNKRFSRILNRKGW